MKMSTLMEQIINSNNNLIDKYTKLSEYDNETIIKVINNINKDKLYNSKIHGLYHSKKVFLFCYLIAKQMKLNKIDMQILIDAALYHDIGRINDYEDSLHGYCSALRIEDAVNHPIYKDEENLNILKAIIDGHSVADEHKERFIFDYDIKNEDRYYLLYDILKDADALDRNRFYNTSDAYLDKSYLRTDYSKKLIALSLEINNIYKSEINKNAGNKHAPEKGKFQCFHSIGFDFFKLASVLEHGILSKSEMKNQNISGASNFEGGNLDDFVSVVDCRMIDKGGTAFPTFIMNGISFLCNVDELYSTDKKYTRSYCIENGIPYNQSLHDDEKYVKTKVDPNQINSIFISKEVYNNNVDEVIYLYNSLSYEIIESRIKHYFHNVKEVFEPDKTIINQLLREYNKKLQSYYKLDHMGKNRVKQELVKNLETIRVKMNEIIQKWIYQKYFILLNKKPNDNIVIEDVLTYELQKSGYNFEKIITPKGYLYKHEKIKTKTL